MNDDDTQPEADTAESAGGASRFVLAIIMAAVLGIATSIAVAIAHSAQARRAPQLTEASLGAFEFAVPERWARQDTTVSLGSKSLPLMRFHENAGFDRQLTVTEVYSEQPTPPLEVSNRAASRLGLKPQTLGVVRSSGVHRFGAVLAATYQAQYLDEDGEPRHRFIAIATLDGRRHLVIDIASRFSAASINIELAERLLERITDTRYTVVEGPQPLNGSVVEPVDGLLALRKASDAGGQKLIFVPSEDARFMLLQALALDVSKPFDLLNARIAGASDEINVVPVSMLTQLDPSKQTTPDARLTAAMHWRFWRATGYAPDARLGRGRLLDDGKHLHEMVLNRAVHLPTFRALFGVTITDTDAALIEVIAQPPQQRIPGVRGVRTIRNGPTAAGAVSAFARAVAAAIHPPGGMGPPPHPSENGAESPPAADPVDPPPVRADDKEAGPTR